MRHLVFTAKWVGLRCLTYLLDNFPDDDYTIVVGNPDADLIGAELQRRGVSWKPLGEEVLAEVRAAQPDCFDWLLNLWGGYIFKNDILSRARKSLNIHPAYLPYCRGRDPVVWAIRHELPAGVTLHMIETGVDEGAVWYQEQTQYALPCTGGELYDRVIERSWRSFIEQWPDLRDCQRPPSPQAKVALPTFRRRDLHADRLIDADNDVTARQFILRLLAHDFCPSYTAQVLFNGKIHKATLSLTPEEDT